MSVKCQIEYGYRTDDGLNYSLPTHFGTITVEAENEREARRAVIDAAYEKHKPCRSHIKIKKVTRITDSPTRLQEAINESIAANRSVDVPWDGDICELLVEVRCIEEGEVGYSALPPTSDEAVYEVWSEGGCNGDWMLVVHITSN